MADPTSYSVFKSFIQASRVGAGLFVLALFSTIGCLSSTSRTSPAPPASIVPVVKASEGRTSTSLGIVLATSEGRAFVFMYPEPPTSVTYAGTEELPPISISINGNFVPAEVVSTELNYAISGPGWTKSGPLKGTLLSVAAADVPAPAIFGEAMDCNEGEIVGAAGFENESQDDGSPFLRYHDDLEITTMIKYEDPREFYRFTTNRVTGSKQRFGIAYNGNGELVGVIEPIFDPKKDSVMNVVHSRDLKKVLSACAKHVPALEELL